MCVRRRDGPGTTSKQTNGRRDNLATTAPQVTQLPAWLLPELRWDVVTLKSLPAPAAPANCTWLPLSGVRRLGPVNTLTMAGVERSVTLR